MKKLKNKLLAIVCIMILLIVTNTLVSNAAVTVRWNTGDENTKKIEDDKDLAKWAQNNPKRFLKCNINEKVGQTIDLSFTGSPTIDLKNAACMYHEQSGNKAGKYIIRTVIDIKGRNAKVYNEESTKTVTNKHIGALCYTMQKAIEHEKNERHFNWKDAFKTIFFDSATGLTKVIDKRFIANPNKEAMTTGIKNAITKANRQGGAFGDITNTPTKKSTQNTPKLNKDGYLGPFKMNKGGYSPKTFELTVDDKKSQIITQYYTRDQSGNYSKHNVGNLKNNTAFYIKCDSDIKNSWKLELKFGCEGYWGRIVLLEEPASGGQNLAIFSSTDEIEAEESLEWKGVVSTAGSLKIIKKSDEGNKLNGARFLITGPENYRKEVEIVKNGTITITGLAPGTYTVTEIQAPYGYKIADNPSQTVDVKKENVVTVEFINSEDDDGDGQLTAYKYDVDTGQGVAGVTFQLWCRTGWYNWYSNEYTSWCVWHWNDYYSPIGTKTTDSNGYARWTGLNINTGEYGDPRYMYKVQEIGCSEPYDINDQIYLYGSADSWISETEDVISSSSYSLYEESQVTVRFKNKLYGNIKLSKVDDIDPNDIKPMSGVKFKIYYYDESNTKHYISSYTEKENYKTGGPAPSDVSYTTDESKAKEFITDSEGYINLRKIECYRKYYAIETGLVEQEDEDFYRMYKEEVELDLEEPNSTATAEAVVKNQQAYTKISGRVWEDVHDESKRTLRNDLYEDNEGPDPKPKGIEVRIVYAGTDTTVVSEDGEEFITYTDENGCYEFKKVLKSELDNYYVIFKYNGLKYENVIPHPENEIQGSKAEDVDRDEFNEQYSTIEKGVAKNSGNDVTNNLQYNSGTHKSTLVQHLGYLADGNNMVNPVGDNKGVTIYADTSIIDLSDYLKVPAGKKFEEVRNINLGIYEREQPDLAILKDTQNIRVEINGKEHTYNYAQRFENTGVYGDGYDIGVKFGTKYGDMKYTRAIYKSDYTWTNPSDTNKELEVYVTYKIQIKNESTSLRTKVNSIVDYYDKRYNLEENESEDRAIVGTELNEKGNIKYSSRITDVSKEEGNTYNKLTINLDSLLNNQQKKDIYVQFKLPRETIEKMIEGRSNNNYTENIVEINSYSTYDSYNEVYAGIDKDSEPGTATPGNKATYEDDTDAAPPITWMLPQKEIVRRINGKVFFDSTTGGLKSGEIREGDGIYDVNSEKGIAGVKVKLVEKSDLDGSVVREYYTGEGKFKDAQGSFENYKKAAKPENIKEENSLTKEDGSFEITGYIPGNYVIVYTWGDKQYIDKNGDGTLEKITVQNYKGTIYDYDRYINNINDKLWYKGSGNNDPENRYSDAIDDYTTRKDIDEELKRIVYSENRVYSINEMSSTTLGMNIEVEKDENAKKLSSGESYQYTIKNVDFGIVERARQEIELKKRINHLRVTLANGEVISDVDVEEDGTLKGEKSHVTFMNPTQNGTLFNPGFIKVELDNELLQGSKLEVTYRFTFYNHSEVEIIEYNENENRWNVDENYYKFGSSVMKNGNYILKKDNEEKGKVEKSKVVTITPSVIVDYLDKDWGYEENKNEYWTAITKTKYQQDDFIQNKEVPKNIKIFEGNETDINNRIILYTEKLAESKVFPTDDVSVNLDVSKQLTTTDDISLENDTEILELLKPGGREIPSNPGSQSPGKDPVEPDESVAPSVIVTPSTGDNLEYIIPITTGIVALLLLGIGVVIIKKKVL